MKLKTSELQGAALDFAVAEAVGRTKFYWPSEIHPHDENIRPFNPSTKWEQGGPIIEREKLALWFSEATVDEEYPPLQGPCWYCEPSFTEAIADETYRYEIGPTPLIAAMRCFVASKLGDEVEIPEELK